MKCSPSRRLAVFNLLAACLAVAWTTACSQDAADEAVEAEPGTEKVAAIPEAPEVILSPQSPRGPEAAVTVRAREQYAASVKRLESSRVEIAQRFRAATAASDADAQAKIIDAARRAVLKSLIEEIFPAWYGTPWDFNGTSEKPGDGQIACGYFVTTTLRDAGFDVPRIKMAQQPSQIIINSLTGRESISISAGRPIAEIEERIRESGPGLYIVGLDSHVGFVVNDGRSLAFVHSSYYSPPRAVVAEPAGSDNPLARSNYRVVGKVLDDVMMRKWIRGEAFALGERKP